MLIPASRTTSPLPSLICLIGYPACFRGEGTAAGKIVASQIQHNLDPINTIEEIDGEDFSPHPLDSCDAGQLEACAIERSLLNFKQSSRLERIQVKAV